MSVAFDLLQYLTKSLVSQPDLVSFSTEEEGDVTVFKVSVDADDMGRLIGRNGRTAKALRELVSKAAACNKEGKVQVVIVE